MSIIDFKEELNLQSNEQRIRDILDQTNHGIKERDEKITIRELYDRLGVKSERDYPDPYIDCWVGIRKALDNYIQSSQNLTKSFNSGFYFFSVQKGQFI